MKSLKLSNSEYIDTTEEEVTPEERMGLNPPTEEKLQRTNPKRYDARTDWYNQLNEHGHDSPISNRYDNSIPLESSLKLSRVIRQSSVSIVDEMSTGEVGTPFFFLISSGVTEIGEEGDAHLDIPSYKDFRFKQTKPIDYTAPAVNTGRLYGRISPQKNTIVFWAPYYPSEEDFPYIVECIYNLQQKNVLVQNPQIYFGGSDTVYSLQSLRKMFLSTESSLKLQSDSMDDMMRGTAGYPFVFNLSTGNVEMGSIGDTHTVIPSFEDLINSKKNFNYGESAQDLGAMYGRITSDRGMIVFWIPTYPNEEDIPYVLECIYVLQKEKQLSESPRIFFSESAGSFTTQRLRSYLKIDESSLHEKIESLDWEIERTIESRSGLKIASMDKESFIDKIKKRYNLAVNGFQIQNPRDVLKKLNIVLKNLMLQGEYDKGQRYINLIPLSKAQAQSISDENLSSFNYFFIGERVFKGIETYYDLIGTVGDAPEIIMPAVIDNLRDIDNNRLASSPAEINNKIFQQRVNQSGDNGPVVFWGSKEGQQSRFQFLLTFGNKLSDDQLHNMYSGKSILDIGTGYGDLLKYLKAHDIEPEKFVGVDIEPKAIEIAKKQDPAVTFLVRDILKDPFPENSFDFVTGVGIFALNSDNYMQYVRDMLKSMLSSCRIMTAVNFPAGQSPQGDFIQVTPQMIKDLLNSGITKAYSIEIDNVNQEFTLYLVK